ncbi:hypothetical protein L3040_008816 [Drepanopeziza brunnea f. sp. 'multigermtubi']|nr:hypothetical protein L3040_008816 [Drepanopeziza brunnea f. sp. 'multigermtubi']
MTTGRINQVTILIGPGVRRARVPPEGGRVVPWWAARAAARGAPEPGSTGRPRYPIAPTEFPTGPSAPPTVQRGARSGGAAWGLRVEVTARQSRPGGGYWRRLSTPEGARRPVAGPALEREGWPGRGHCSEAVGARGQQSALAQAPEPAIAPRDTGRCGARQGVHARACRRPPGRAIGHPRLERGVARPRLERGVARPRLQRGVARPRLQRDRWGPHTALHVALGKGASCKGASYAGLTPRLPCDPPGYPAIPCEPPAHPAATLRPLPGHPATRPATLRPLRPCDPCDPPGYPAIPCDPATPATPLPCDPCPATLRSPAIPCDPATLPPDLRLPCDPPGYPAIPCDPATLPPRGYPAIPCEPPLTPLPCDLPGYPATRPATLRSPATLRPCHPAATLRPARLPCDPPGYPAIPCDPATLPPAAPAIPCDPRHPAATLRPPPCDPPALRSPAPLRPRDPATLRPARLPDPPDPPPAIPPATLRPLRPCDPATPRLPCDLPGYPATRPATLRSPATLRPCHRLPRPPATLRPARLPCDPLRPCDPAHPYGYPAIPCPPLTPRLPCDLPGYPATRPATLRSPATLRPCPATLRPARLPCDPPGYPAIPCDPATLPPRGYPAIPCEPPAHPAATLRPARLPCDPPGYPAIPCDPATLPPRGYPAIPSEPPAHPAATLRPARLPCDPPGYPATRPATLRSPATLRPCHPAATLRCPPGEGQLPLPALEKKSPNAEKSMTEAATRTIELPSDPNRPRARPAPRPRRRTGGGGLAPGLCAVLAGAAWPRASAPYWRGRPGPGPLRVASTASARQEADRAAQTPLVSLSYCRTLPRAVISTRLDPL